jgi:hypothetical protein
LKLIEFRPLRGDCLLPTAGWHFVSSHNQIKRFAIVDELPRTPLGKIALQALPEVFSNNEVKRK